MLEFLRNHIVLDIVVLSMGLFVYFMIPSLDIMQLIADFQAYSANHTSVESINKLLSDLVEKQQEFENFVVLIKFFVSLIVTIVLFSLSYFYYSQQEFQKQIQELKEQIEELQKQIKKLKTSNETKFTNVGSRIVGIDKTLQIHFEDYAELVKYNSFAGNKIIHHSFEDALKYDVDKINSLQQGATYKSTVILKDSYIERINSNESLKEYIETLMEKAQNGEVTVTRIFIADHSLSNDEKQHLRNLKGSGINVRIIDHGCVKEIKKNNFVRQEISDNFIIINETEVAFSYPHDGFRFAVNLIDDDKNDQVKNICDNYKSFFDEISKKSEVFEYDQ